MGKKVGGSFLSNQALTLYTGMFLIKKRNPLTMGKTEDENRAP